MLPAERSTGRCGCPETLALDKYHTLPPMARFKALIIEHGVTFDNPFLFNTYEGIDRFKTKKRILKPTCDGMVVTDTSKDPSLIPAEIIIGNEDKESIVKLGYREKSPIGIQVNADQSIALLDRSTGIVLPLHIQLVEKNPYTDVRVPADIDPDRHPLEDFVGLVGLDRLSIMPFDGCWNWNNGSPCNFCDYNPKSADYDTAKALTNTLKRYDLNIDTWWNASKDRYLQGLAYTMKYIKEHGNIGPHKHLLLMSGNLPESTYVWKIAGEVADTLNTVDPIASYDNYLNVCPHPTVDMLKDMKAKGIKQVQYNLEVIGEKTFAYHCPGKLPYTQFKEKLVEAVDIMGRGNVRSNFVLGLQPIDELLEGVSELAALGVVADYSIFQPKRSTPLEHFPSPSMDTIVAFTTKLADLYKKYGYKAIYCSLSSRSSIINEAL